jgi:serine/threonine-protein kinase
VDYRADIFACGVILFEMLTNRRLFYGETDYQTVELVRQARVPSLTALNPEIPSQLDKIVRTALAREPEERFQHAYEVQDQLAQFLFSRGLKVTSRDVASLVRRCLEEQQQTAPVAKPRGGGVIDTLIQEEIVKFTSLDSEDFPSVVGAEPLSPEDLVGSGALDPKDFIDPRDWTDEFASGRHQAMRRPEAVVEEQLPEVTSLESMLEGEDVAPPPQTNDSDGGGRSIQGLIIALVIFVLLGAATVFILHTLGLIGDSSAQNQDIVKPE